MITVARRECSTKIGHLMVKVAKKVLLMGRFVQDCPFLARKLESDLEIKPPRKSKNYKGIMWWPGTSLRTLCFGLAGGIACGRCPGLTQSCANLLYRAKVRLAEPPSYRTALALLDPVLC